MNGGAKCRRGAVSSACLVTLKVIGSVTIRYSACDFLFNFNRNYAAIGQVFSTYDRDNHKRRLNFAPVLTQEPGQTLRFAPVPFMAVL